MARIPVIAILDVGKTNKKLILFDEDYKVRFEKFADIPETIDEDQFPCEDIAAITQWVTDSIREVVALQEFHLKAINFSAHGASLVHLDERGKVIAPLYNYLKPYPEHLRRNFYKTYGGEVAFSQNTASPVLGSLNSGMQLYHLEHEQPALFSKIRTSLHLPQYLSYLLTGQTCSDITSIGCHTGLWDFKKNDYHRWVHDEGVYEKLAPLRSCDTTTIVDLNGYSIAVGIGLHDSSAALTPYLKQFGEDFVLLSTGTWNITLNPFNADPLTEKELANDCLCYLNYRGNPVKASRLYAGHAHQQQVERIAEYFHQGVEYHLSIPVDKNINEKLNTVSGDYAPSRLLRGDFFTKDLSSFKSFEEAYFQLIVELVGFQKTSTSLVLSTETKSIFVDGGFSKNKIYMSCLAGAIPNLNLSGATVAQASALGAAMAIHQHWNSLPIRRNIIELSKEN